MVATLSFYYFIDFWLFTDLLVMNNGFFLWLSLLFFLLYNRLSLLQLLWCLFSLLFTFFHHLFALLLNDLFLFVMDNLFCLIIYLSLCDDTVLFLFLLWFLGFGWIHHFLFDYCIDCLNGLLRWFHFLFHLGLRLLLALSLILCLLLSFLGAFVLTFGFL